MKQNQLSNATSYDRYPEIFREVSTIISDHKSDHHNISDHKSDQIKESPNILSFGCSRGLECKVLSDKYFPESKIIGLDISEDVINNNIKNNKHSNIQYFSDIKLLKETKFDLIFAMSVLCRWPESHGEYTFETFTTTLEIIDSLLDINGYLCIYNSKYLFTDSEISTKYKIIETKHQETGFVYKYRKDGTKIKDYPYFLFQKVGISDVSDSDSSHKTYTIKRSTNKNLGDGLVHYGFIDKLCDNPNINMIDLNNEYDSENYLTIGSVFYACDRNSIICGTGFISEKDSLGSIKWKFDNKVYNRPKDILFVRGPKTRDKLISIGVDCPESYGDMGILLPLVYPIKYVKNKKYKVGILPHYMDIRYIKPLEDFLKGNNISYVVLNIRKADNCQGLIDELSDVEYLITSTLHGIITGLSYNINTIWVKFSDKLTGGVFKYEDFFLSVDYEEYKYIDINSINANIFDNTIKLPKYKLQKLGLSMLERMPFFLDENTRENKIELWKNITNNY